MEWNVDDRVEIEEENPKICGMRVEWQQEERQSESSKSIERKAWQSMKEETEEKHGGERRES